MRDVTEIAPGLANAGAPIEGVITAGQPGEEHLQALADAGYRTIIDLRTSQEERGYDEPATARHAGMEYINLPVGPESLDGTKIERFRELMNDADRRPALVHCSSANRVGALLMPYMILDEDKSREEATRIARQIGLKSNELEQKVLEYARSNGG